ncbi:MAG: hypothetical protein AB7G12_11295 [Thermoanaerobaculia bacterium]
MTRFRRTLAIVLLLLPSTLAAQTVRLGSIDNSRFGSSWTLNGPAMATTREKLLEDYSFGAGGIVERVIDITDTADEITATLLQDFDLFFIGYLWDESDFAFSDDELDAFYSWVEGGGAMLITCDGVNYDAVCERFGAPIAGGTDHLANATGPGFGHPVLDGPFGAVLQIGGSGSVGRFADDVGGNVLMRSSRGTRPMVIAARIGAGRVVLITDVDMISGFGLSPGSYIDYPNDVFLGNAVAWLAGVSDPGLCAPNATTLCIDGAPGDGRFSVRVSYDTVLGGGLSGEALATPLVALGASAGGLFTFFDPSNPELVVKIIDGCFLTDHFWVYSSAGTNAGFAITIEDLLLGGPPKVYVNPDLTPAFPVQDIYALPCS